MFGGNWSLSKLDIVERYFHFFNTALKQQAFRGVYIDGFVGSGAFRYIVGPPRNGWLFGLRDESEHVYAGSAKRALNTSPPFDEVIVIEQKRSHAKSLQELIDKSGHANARVECGEANEVLHQICRSDWSSRRGIVFLDPFGMNVDWSTLTLIAATKALDLWFLFSVAGLVRNLPRRVSRLDASKRAAVTRVLGTDEWFDEFYKVPENPFFTLPRSAARRAVSLDQIEAYVLKRLRTVFPHVEPPRRLMTRKNRSLFSLFFAVSNPSQAAITLAQKGAAHILKTSA